MIKPLTFEEFSNFAKTTKKVALFQEVDAQKLTPFCIYNHLNKTLKTEGVMLEDLHQGEAKRYSFLCFKPITTVTLSGDHKNSPLEKLRNIQSILHYKVRDDVAHLITSAIGFVTYDAVRYFEVIPDRHSDDSSLPLALFSFYSLSVTFDHQKQTILVSILVDVSTDVKKVYKQAQEKLQSLIQHILSPSLGETQSCRKKHITSSIEVDISDTKFIKMIEKAKKYIHQGDAFQIVLSRCFKRQYAVSPLSIYEALCEVSPAPFMFYLPTEDRVIIGASPERFVRVNDKIITVNPIAGTKKRMQNTNKHDIEANLLTNKKELAEHMMLVDLARNDVGAVSIPGTVEVSELLHVKHYSHVSHITSTVIGHLQDNYDPLDAFAASFPAGTLTGAPKIRAMEIIDELESSRRGLYGGAICRFDALNNLESCIAIRMAMLQNGVATIRTGAGIVYDSDPMAEAQETYQKAQSMLDAIAKAHGEK